MNFWMLPPDRLRIGVAGCQKWEHGYFDAWGHLAAEPDLDLVFHYGDYIYEGAPTPLGPYIPRQHLGDKLYSLDDYRRRYAQYKADPHLQASHAACAFAVSFDDHEVDNNWAGEFDRDGTPPEIFALRRLAALQAPENFLRAGCGIANINFLLYYRRRRIADGVNDAAPVRVAAMPARLHQRAIGHRAGGGVSVLDCLRAVHAHGHDAMHALTVTDNLLGQFEANVIERRLENSEFRIPNSEFFVFRQPVG